MLNQSYAKDRLLAELIDEVGPMAGLVCFGLIPFQDRDGRIHGDPRVLKGQCWPRVDSITPEVIEAAVRACHEKQILIWYEVDGDKWICFPGFAKNQEGFRYDRESESTIPPPPPELLSNWRKPRELVLANSGITPATAGITPQNSAELRQLPAEVEVQDQVEVEQKRTQRPDREPEPAISVALVPAARIAELALGGSAESLQIQTVWAKYREHHPSCPGTLKQARKEYRLARDRLRDFTVAQLCSAIDGYHRSPFHCGDNDQGTKHLGFELIMRDVGHVTKGIEMAEDPKLGQPRVISKRGKELQAAMSVPLNLYEDVS